MIRSMTGFARRERQFPWGLLAWEIKTVNHRFLELGCRLPEEFRAAESDFSRPPSPQPCAAERSSVSLHFRPAVVATALEVDAELLASLTLRAQQVAAQAGVAARIDVLDLLRWPGVIRDGTRDTAPMIAAAQALLLEALSELTRSRDSEGGRPCARHWNSAVPDWSSSQDALATGCRRSARACAPSCSTASRSWSPTSIKIASKQELAILAQRLDVDEEIERLRGHVTEVRKTFDGKEPAGRRLDFLMQELNREANTLSSKSQDIETTRRRRRHESAHRTNARAGAEHRVASIGV